MNLTPALNKANTPCFTAVTRAANTQMSKGAPVIRYRCAYPGCTKRYSKPRPPSSDEDESDDELDKDPEELNQLITEAADFTSQSAPRSKRQAASHAERAISQQNLRAERGSLIAWDQTSLQSEVDSLKATVAAGAAEQPLIIHLRALHAKSLTVDLLSATGVGKVVAQLRKHESTKVSAMDAALVKGWKALVTAQK